MCKFILLFTCLGIATAQADGVESYRWKNRLLVVFFSDCTMRETFDRVWGRQAAGMRERDLILLRADEELRKRWAIRTDANVAILVGKDGLDKARWTSVPDPAEVFSRIDAMPMRKAEIGEQNR